MPLLGLNPETPLIQYRYRQWNVEHGLPEASIKALNQSADGYIWVGSERGLTRFDGEQFLAVAPDTKLETAARMINCLWFQTNKVLWAGGKDGLIIQYPNRQKIDFGGTNSNIGLDILCFCQDRTQRIWVGTTQGIRLYTPGAPPELATVFTNINVPVYAIVEDNEHQLWFGTQQGAYVCSLSNLNIFQAVTTTPPMPRIPVYALCNGHTGSMWMGTSDGLYHSSSGRLGRYAEDQGLKDKKIHSLYRDSNGTLWIGTARGVNRFFYREILPEATIPTLENLSISGFLEDHEKNLWIASSSGIHCLTDPLFTTLSAKNGAPDEAIRVIVEKAPGILVVGTEAHGIFELQDNGLNRNQYSPSSLTINSLLIDKNGDLWAATRNKGIDLFTRDVPKNYTLEHGLLSLIVSALYEDRQGRIWAGTSQGLNCRVNDAWRTVRLPQLARNPAVRTIAEMKNGDLWIGANSGIAVIAPVSTNYFSKADGLSENLVYCISQDSQDRIWAGTANGIACYSDGRWHQLPNPSLNSRHHVYWIADDHSGSLWYSSLSGIYKISMDDIAQFIQKPGTEIYRRSFTQADGLLSCECYGGVQPAGCQTKDGKLWFPTRRGLAMADPKHMAFNDIPPPVHIQQIMVDGQAFPAGETVTLPAGARLVEFQYAALSYENTEKVRYRRQLIGIENAWSKADSMRSAAYANLRPGSYRFQVIACNNDGVWNNTGAIVSFTLLPYFYQTTWFIGLCGLSLAFAIFGWHTWRTRLLCQQKNALQILVQERTIELEKQMLQRLNLEEKLSDSRKLEAVGQLASGVAHYFNNTLAIIQGNASLLKEESLNKEAAASLDDITDASQKSAHLVKQLLAFARRHWIHLQPVDLISLFSKHVHKLQKTASPSISIQSQFSPPPMMVLGDEQTLDQAISGLTANALEAMPGGGILTLAVSVIELKESDRQRHPDAVAGRFAVLTIADTGKGMAPDVLNRMFEPFFTTKDVGEGTGLGLAAVYGIIKQHNGWIEAESTPGKGSSIRVLLPVQA